MPFHIDNVAQVSRLIVDTASLANKLQAFRDEATRLQRLVVVNGIVPILDAPAAVFPANFNLTPAQVSACLVSLGVIKAAVDSAMTQPHTDNIDAVRLNMGVLVGTG